MIWGDMADISSKNNLLKGKAVVNFFDKVKSTSSKKGGAGEIPRTNIGQQIFDLANRTWGSKYLYMVSIQRLNTPFDLHMLPAYSVQERLPLARVENIKLPVIGNFPLPVGRELPSIQISLYDTEYCEVEKSLRDWIADISPFHTSIQYLDDITSTLILCRLSYDRKLVMMNFYDVYPSGDLLVNLTSDNGLKELVVDFNVTQVYQRTDYEVK